MTTILALWCMWALSWSISASWSNATEASLGADNRYRIPNVIGSALIFVPAIVHVLVVHRWDVGDVRVWICTALVALGLSFAWWARLHLGRLWSGNITVKAGHRVVDTGPYSLVRHPIYTGLLLANLATAVAVGTILSAAGFLFILIGFWLKARFEEQWLAKQLGECVYREYCDRVPMFLPLIPKH